MNAKEEEVFARFVPDKAVPYCANLYREYGFEFQIKKSRKTKLGDYRFERKSGKHTITINNDLNTYAFLVTYLHEVAHLITQNQFQGRVSPHGKEWKLNFKKLAAPMIHPEVFPDEILRRLASYLTNPKASSCSDPELYKILRKFDPPNGKIMLSELSPDQLFEFNAKTYLYIEKRRTRILCQEASSKKKYLISQLAEVTPKSSSHPTNNQ